MPRRNLAKSKPRSHIPRDTLLISHAIEDNEFTLWLTLQLAKEGYRVWCDLTKLLGGENFWDDIEQVLRNRGCKFVYVLSHVSNGGAERGFRKELHLADVEAKHNGSKDFIIPVAIDDLPSAEYNVYLSLRQSIAFFPSWRDGLVLLLKKLSRDRVPKRKRKFNPQNVAAWWRSYRSSTSGVLRQPDKYFSNWFAIPQLPTRIYIHTLENGSEKTEHFLSNWPAYCEGSRLVTFAPAADFPQVSEIADSQSFAIADMLDRSLPIPDEELHQLRRSFVRLLGLSLEKRIREAHLGSYELANGKLCWFFLKPPNEEALKVHFDGIGGTRDWRALTGFATIASQRDKASSAKRYWHFAIQVHAKFRPYVVFHITSHVVFSDDGKTPWSDKKRMHRARRRQCKSWYNDAWRDRLLAAVTLVSEEKRNLEIPVASGESIIMDSRPMIFESEVSFSVISKKAIEESRATEEIADDGDDSDVPHEQDDGEPSDQDSNGEDGH
ncbi:MAG TPA: toll/interleukin-1 receptor domain-containing protein [Candidatus Acidoferrales bacterium]|nr:toll/interleukin-1 receptor domain-containing protein [Candidatus Acidoferrales bacterium]